MSVGDAGIGDVDLVELGLPGHLAQRSGLDPGGVHVQNKVGETFVLGRIDVGASQQQSPAGFLGEAGPHLLPVDHPVPIARAIAHRGGGQPCEIRTGARLGEELAPDVFGGGQGPQEERLDVLALGVFANGRCRHAVAHRVQPEWHRPAGLLQDVVGDCLQSAGGA